MKRPPVTDHAIVRYLERVCKVNLDGVRREIYRNAKHAINSGANKITVNGFDYKIANGRVITIVPAGRKKPAPASAFREWDKSNSKDETNEQPEPVQLERTKKAG